VSRPDASGHASRPRLLAGGFGLVFAILGFTAVQAVVRGAGLPTDWVLFAMPAFGALGFVSLVVFVSAIVAP
jgi:hypothetical protein